MSHEVRGTSTARPSTEPASRDQHLQPEQLSLSDVLTSPSASHVFLSQQRRSAAASSRMKYRSHPVSVAVDPVSLVISECINITSAIQKHAHSQHLSVSAILGGGAPNVVTASFKLGASTETSVRRSGRRGGAGSGARRNDVEFGPANRWGLRGKKGKSMADNPLISGFGRLRQELAGVKDILTFDSLMLLYPFLQIIQAKGTAAPITILALRAVRKFLAYGFLCPESPRFVLAMQALSQAITHCQFDISDSAQEEVVLLMILNLMEDMLSGPGGDILSDESVCDMMGRGLTICSRPRFSEVLRQTAEATMVRMCQIIFEDLKHLEEEAGEEADALDRQTDADMDTVKMDPATVTADGQAASPVPPTEDLVASPVPPTDGQVASPVPPSTEGTAVATPAAETSDSSSNEDSNDTYTSSASGEAKGKEPAAAAAAAAAATAAATTSAERPSTDSHTDDADRKSTTSGSSGSSESIDLRPYSLPSVRELFRVLVDFLDPSQRTQQPDTMRVMALRIIHVALEVAGPSIARHPALAAVAQDRLCCYLFQLVRSDNMAILQESLIVASTLLSTCRGVLKLQQELYLAYLISCLHPAVDIPREADIDPSLYEGIPQAPKLVKPPPSQTSSGRSTPVQIKDRQKLGMEGGMRKPEARQAMVENIGVLARMPTFFIELFVNYDCDTDRADLCEDLIGLLSRNALPDSATWSTTSVPPLCLDALLRYIQFMAQRLDEPAVYEGYPDPEELRESRARKKIIVRGANKFNENAKGGLAFLHDKGIIADIKDPVLVAGFLKGTSRVSKRALGDFLSKKGNEPILAAFMDLFDFEGKRVDEALRVMLETFRLPGEAPLIERIVSSFAERYCSRTMPEEVADKDSVFILTYAIILLNTDQHNPNVRQQKRMTVGDFSRNLRGQNGGKDFAAGYLQEIYDSIRSNEIILPEEHENKHAFDYAWREVLLKAGTSGPLVSADTNVYDADMFATTWRPIVATLSYVFMSATDDTVFSRVIQGFDECARIAAQHDNTAAMDQIVYCLSRMSTLALEVQHNTSLNTEVQVEDASVMVSELAVKLGRNFRAQLATLVLFRVVTENEHILRTSWRHVIRIWLNLFQNSLIPAFFSSEPGRVDLPPIPLQSPGQVIDRGNKQADSGFFSAFTSYISSYAADDPPEPSDEELESTLCAIDCVNACHVGDVFANIGNLTGESLESLVDALLDQIPEDNNTGVVIKVKAENVPPTSPANNVKASATPAYDPAPVYLLELSTVLALRDAASVQLVGKRVVDALQEILRDVTRFHPILIGRATYYLFKMLRASYDYDFVRVPVLLHAVSSFSKENLKATSAVVLQGLKFNIAEPGPLRSEIMTSPDFWAILGTLVGYEDAAPTVFDILESGVSGTPPAIIADNYEAAIILCNKFATAASIGALAEQTRDRKQPRRSSSRAPKQEKPSENASVQRGIKAIDIIYNMTSRIPHLMKQSHLESNEAWSAYWLPIFQALTTQCTNPCREVRHLAFSSLQRSLLSPELTSSDHREWTAIFSEVLFPLILELLRPEVYSSDRDGMSETRVQVASLLCKVFLQYLVLLSDWDGMLDLWIKIIDIMDRLMNSGQGDSLEEAVPENLKNVLLFMASSGYLVPPSRDASKEELWVETWKRIDRFLPDLRNELALDGVEEPEPKAEKTEKDEKDEKDDKDEKDAEPAPESAAPNDAAAPEAVVPPEGEKEASEGTS